MARIDLRDVSTAIGTSEAFLAFTGKKAVRAAACGIAAAYRAAGSAPRNPVAMT